jgi:hypothetical protein
MYDVLVLIVLGYICTIVSQSRIRQMLIEAGQVIANFQGIKIPGSMGIAVMLGTVAAVGMAIPFDLVEPLQALYVVFAGSLMGFAGLIDDLLGNNSSKGFKGHIKGLMKGKLTTGGLKAIIGFISAFIVSIQVSKTFYDIIANIFLISLVTNLINLLDTRPGRAIKGFILLTLLSLLLGTLTNIHYIVLGALLAYLPLDLKARGMLGDTGANFIGMALGIGIVIAVKSFMVRFILLTIVFLLNLISEKYSFSKAIEGNRVLNFIDRLGRGR